MMYLKQTSNQWKTYSVFEFKHHAAAYSYGSKNPCSARQFPIQDITEKFIDITCKVFPGPPVLNWGPGLQRLGWHNCRAVQYVEVRVGSAEIFSKGETAHCEGRSKVIFEF